MADVEKSASPPPEALAVQEIHSRKLGLSTSYESKVALLNWHITHEVGFGRFQWTLTALAAFGWFVDNAWFQCVYVATPEVQLEFDIAYIGWASLALYAGLIVGTFGWGIVSDIVGRRLCFNTTLLVSSVFGLAAGGANNYVTFCALLACTGLGVGGNIPVDSALYLEFIPGTHQWMLTLLSMFWSLGTLFVALIGWGFIATYSCAGAPCTRENNMGWRYVFFTTGSVVFAMWILRFFVYRIPESPKYLIARGRDAEAVSVVHYMAKQNGRISTLTLEKLRAAAGESVDDLSLNQAELSPTSWTTGKSLWEMTRQSLAQFKFGHVRALFATWKIGSNTLLLTLLWGLIGAASPLYNAFIIVFISEKGAEVGQSSIYTTYRQYAITSTVGIPAAIIAAALVELPRSGRKGAMALSTALTGVFLFLFTTSRNAEGILGWNCALSLTQDIMYGVIYAYTPESYPAPQRGTGYAISMTFNRIMGVAMLLIGRFMEITPTKPVYVSASLLLVTAVLMLLLPIETGNGRMAV
ncbi:MFS general substrate transporter [Dacryopinax primogenitus]|uniref:MFS general substrate transporter n=1 Tax=Dacryopinax primogenitus (strain DJM 731) TaxID=1858805 RepID=M5G8C8_DACPD|nr:MFS general substrate transporter [Dacryopinax primogenitus]EJU05014.1 MFS general substrate transporter [Dacryopinax primogenitus]